MLEHRKRLHCVAEITLSTTFLLASEVPSIAAFARSGLPQERNFKKCERGTINLDSVPRSRVLELRFLGRCLVVGRTKDAIRAGTAQTPPLCRRDYTINDISTCVRSSGNCSVCSVRPTPKAQLVCCIQQKEMLRVWFASILFAESTYCGIKITVALFGCVV